MIKRFDHNIGDVILYNIAKVKNFGVGSGVPCRGQCVLGFGKQYRFRYCVPCDLLFFLFVFSLSFSPTNRMLCIKHRGINKNAAFARNAEQPGTSQTFVSIEKLTYYFTESTV